MPKKWSPVKLTSVEDIIADDVWEYHKLGRKMASRVAVGRPAPDPSGQDWYCPLLFENETKGWTAVYGVGAVDALMNAMMQVRRHFHEYLPTPRSGKPKRQQRRPR
jgi:hypothetical protein